VGITGDKAIKNFGRSDFFFEIEIDQTFEVKDFHKNITAKTVTYKSLSGFDKDYYLNAKLQALQEKDSNWSDKDLAYLEAFLLESGFTAEDHYLQFDYKEGLAPNAYFNHSEYVLAIAEDMYNSGDYSSIKTAQTAFYESWHYDVYQHYILYGSAKGINPSNNFDEKTYLSDALTSLKAEKNSREYLTIEDLRDLLNSLGVTIIDFYIDYEIAGSIRNCIDNPKECQNYTIELPVSGSYGNNVPNGEKYIGQVNFSFNGMVGNTNVKYYPYDVDSNTELEILINGQFIGYSPKTDNNAWGDMVSIILPDTYVYNNAANTLTFSNFANPPKYYIWGVKNISVKPDNSGIQLPASGIYGNLVPDSEINFVDQVNFNFKGMVGGAIVKYYPYDVDFSTELEILVNGQFIGYAPTTDNNAWGDMDTIILPDIYVNDTNTNIITFNNSTNPPKYYIWGVKNISILEDEKIQPETETIPPFFEIPNFGNWIFY